MNIRQILEGVVADRCVALFHNYGLALAQVGDSAALTHPLLYCGVMGYSGQGIRGSLAIAGSSELLTASNPTRRGAPREWAGELANQLTGHLKNGLLAHGVEVFLSLPTVLRGEHLSLHIRGETRPLLFTAAGHNGLLGIWMDVETTPTFQIADEADSNLAGLAAGDVLEF